MALTISTPYKTNTLASVSGVTFNSNGTPFVPGDVGRFLVFTNGPAIGQIRRIVGYTSSSVVTVDLAWNVSQISAFTDSLPAAGNTWQMSLTLDDIDDGVHIIKESDAMYRQVEAAGTVALNGVFLADTSLTLDIKTDIFLINTTARLCLGYLHPNGYGMYGCTIHDRMSSSSTGGWVGGISSPSPSGDVHLYGCNVHATLTGISFWRLFRGADQIVRFVDCDMNGNFAGRVQGTRSCLDRCTYRGNTSASAVAGIGAIAPFGLVRDCRVQASNQAVYVAYSLGVGDLLSPTFDAISGTILQASSGVPSGVQTQTIQDYVQSQIESAPFVAIHALNDANARISFRQWVDGSIVNQSLAAITDEARRVIRNGAATVVDNATTTSGAFARYVAEVRRFSLTTGSKTWADGTGYGPYEEAIASYLYQPQTLDLPLPTSSNVQFTMLSDLNVTQTTKATVDAYTLISSADRLYDRYKSWFVDNLATVYPTFGVQKLTGSGSVLDCGSANIVVDATAASAFAVNHGTDTITIKASTLLAGTTFTSITTTGTITFVNGAAAGPALVYTDSTGTSVTVAVGGVRNGTKVRVIRTDTSAELAIGTAGASGFTARVTWSTDLPIRADTAYVSGLDAEVEASALGTLTNTGAALTVVQTPCAIYEGNGIDGSAVTGLTLDVPNIEIDADEADNAMTVQEIYAWFKYTLMSDDGIRTIFGGITPENAHKYRINTSVVPLKIDQKDLVNSLVLSGGMMYRDDGASIRLASSGVIEFVVDDVYESRAAEALLDAIKSKTDNLPTDPADQSAVDAAIAAIPAPDNASIASILADTNELQTNQGQWVTATGFATPTNVSDAQTAIIAQVDANEAKIDLIETKAQADARQALLIAEHDATQAGLSSVTVSSTSEDSIVDKVWDEVLTGATHNVPASAGRRVRQLASSIIIDGTAVSATTNTIVLDSSASSSNGAYDPAIIHISTGTGVGQSRIILEYNGATKTAIVNRDWKVTPNATSEYVIQAHSDNASVNEGLAQGGSTNTITLNALASDDNDSYVGQSVFLVSGTGADQLGLVIDYNGTTKVATIAGNWAHTPNATSGYVMLPNSPVLLGATTHTGAIIPNVTLVDTTTTNTDMIVLTPVTDAITAQTVDLKGASNKDLTQVFDNTPSVNLTPVTDALALQDIEIATIKTQSTLARKHLTNRDKIDTTAKTLTRYDDDGTTVMKVFDLKNSSGDASSSAIFEKVPQ